ncbi:MAG: methyltransferase domain-containing protein [Nocardioidaceae bacterium]
MVDNETTTREQRWLTSTWPFVREHLPPPPGQILEIGCGPLGGFVPALRSEGYDAIGIDPEAPEGSDFQRTEFERHEVTRPPDAVVACTSLHHVADLADVVGRIASALVPGGTLVVVEWAWERFDENTAKWCFEHVPADGADDHPSWLQRHREDWAASGQSWTSYLRGWVHEERMHSGLDIVRALRARFDTHLLTDGTYFFADLDGVTPASEQDAIDARHINACGIRYVGQARTV